MKTAVSPNLAGRTTDRRPLDGHLYTGHLGLRRFDGFTSNPLDDGSTTLTWRRWLTRPSWTACWRAPATWASHWARAAPGHGMGRRGDLRETAGNTMAVPGPATGGRRPSSQPAAGAGAGRASCRPAPAPTALKLSVGVRAGPAQDGEGLAPATATVDHGRRRWPALIILSLPEGALPQRHRTPFVQHVVFAPPGDHLTFGLLLVHSASLLACGELRALAWKRVDGRPGRSSHGDGPARRPGFSRRLP